MTTTKEQVLEMVSAGKISAAEGEELLGAMQTPPRPAWRRLIDPFDGLGAAQSLLLGALGAAGGILLSRWHVRFDGALDVHVGPALIPLPTAVLDQLVAWPLLAVILWATAWAVARRGRAIDFFGSVGVARLPLLAIGIVGGALRDQLPMNTSQIGSVSPIPLIILVVFTLPAVVWMLMLLFHGFRTASGLSRPKVGLPFAVAVVVAEVLSKLALYLVR
jgi:hypothetical protein